MYGLKQKLLSLPPLEQRIVLSLMGNAIGDSMGIPFELSYGTKHRKLYRQIEPLQARGHFAFRTVVKLCQDEKPSPFVRPYSDDTTVCDLKMEAVAQAERILEKRPDTSPERALELCLLQQYLKWAHNTTIPGGSADRRGTACGELFQGTGAFTNNFLIPHFRCKNNEVARVMKHKPLYMNHPDFGPFWPTEEFAIFAKAYFAGEHCFPSWGNGTVMSFCPHPILAGRYLGEPAEKMSDVRASLAASADVLSRTHQESGAVVAARLLWELLDLVYSGKITRTEQLRQAVPELPSVQLLDHLVDHGCYPLQAFVEWLQHGDCRVETAQAFVYNLTGKLPEAERFEAAPSHIGVFGELLRVCADWDFDNRGSGILRRPAPFDKEPVFFSQRALNSVIIAIFCATGAREPWVAFDRCLYIGGDTDTVGAVVGQLACPLMAPHDVMVAFEAFVGLGTEPRGGGLSVANQAARRFLRRAISFACGDFDAIRDRYSLTDPGYFGAVNDDGSLPSAL